MAESHLGHAAHPHQGAQAGIVSRALAAAVDVLVLVGGVLATYGSWAAILFLISPRSFEFPDSSLVWNLTTATVLAVVYLCSAWTLTGRTYGDRVMGLRVVGRNGGHPGLVISALRALLTVMFPIGLLWSAVSHDHRSVQDLLVGTRVIHDWR